MTMCGIFAYTGPGAPDAPTVAAAATTAARRGPHAHGWDGPHTTAHRAAGPLDPRHAATAITGTFIGHARLATTGTPTDPAAIQPAVADGHLIAANGHFPEWDNTGHPTDTAAWAHAYARLRATGHTPAAAVRDLAPTNHPHALIVLDADGTLTAHRNRLPLHALHTGDGVYLSSGPFHPYARPLAPGLHTITRT